MLLNIKNQATALQTSSNCIGINNRSNKYKFT